MQWRGHSSAADEWLRAEELVHFPEKVAEYEAAAPQCREGGIEHHPDSDHPPPPKPAVAPAPQEALLAPRHRELP